MTTETPKQMAERLMGEVERDAKRQYSKGEVKTLLNTIAQRPEPEKAAPKPQVIEEGQSRAPTKVEELRRGDVFIAKFVGGKIRPWIVLQVNEKVVTALAMSSGDHAPNMVPSQCRLWPGRWVGTTVSQFPADLAMAEVTRPYTNWAHLRELEEHVARCIGMAVKPQAPLTIAHISEKCRRKQA